MKLYRRFAFIALILIFTGSCEEPLEENIYSQLSPSTLFSSEQGVNKVLNSAYANAHHNFVGETWSTLFVGATPTEEIWGEFGSIASRWVALRDFSWDANHSQIVAMWTTYFYAIRDANIILDNIESEDLGSDLFPNPRQKLNLSGATVMHNCTICSGRYPYILPPRMIPCSPGRPKKR